MREAEQHILL